MANDNLINKIKSQGGKEIKKEDIKTAPEPEPESNTPTSTMVSIDSDIDSWERLLPLGLHRGIIAGIPVIQKSKKTNWQQMIVPVVALVEDSEGEETTRKGLVYFTFSDDAQGFIKQTFDELGIKYIHNGKKLLFDIAQFKDMPVKILVENSRLGKGRNITLKQKDYNPEQ